MLSGSQKILLLQDLIHEINQHQRLHQKIIFVHGVFDLLHRGHVTLLAEAKKLNGILVAGVESDDNVKKLKGEDRPIHAQDARLFVLSHLQPVDYVFLIPSYDRLEDADAFYLDLYRKLRINVLATCVAAGKFGSLKKAHARDVGIDFVDIPQRYERGTTQVINILKGTIT